jgi:hypothetical protein
MRCLNDRAEDGSQKWNPPLGPMLKESINVDKALWFGGPALGPVGFGQNRQQGSVLCDFEVVELGESGTNHPRGFDSGLVKLR